MSEKEIRLDEVERFETFLRSHGVTNEAILGYAARRRQAIEVDHSEDAATVGDDKELPSNEVNFRDKPGEAQVGGTTGTGADPEQQP